MIGLGGNPVGYPPAHGLSEASNGPIPMVRHPQGTPPAGPDAKEMVRCPGGYGGRSGRPKSRPLGSQGPGLDLGIGPRIWPQAGPPRWARKELPQGPGVRGVQERPPPCSKSRVPDQNPKPFSELKEIQSLSGPTAYPGSPKPKRRRALDPTAIGFPRWLPGADSWHFQGGPKGGQKAFFTTFTQAYGPPPIPR